MAKEIVEKTDTVENITKTQVIDAIKTSKKEYDSSKQQSTVSIQNTSKGSASEIVEKMYSKIPRYVQSYSDLYKKYLDIANSFYTTSYLAQKEFLNKIGIEDSRYPLFEPYLESVRKMVLLQIDLNENMFQTYIGHRLTALDFYDQMMNRNISNFTNMLSCLNNNKTQL